jgi:hypothetical protein
MVATEASIVLAAVCGLLGLAAGEMFDVWYDSTHGEGVPHARGIDETLSLAPKRPLAFGYAKLYFREVLVTPDAFEHYHWGLWLATNSILMAPMFPPVAYLMLGTAVSLTLDENRRGLADQPFGLGKPYFTASAFVGILLGAVLILRFATFGTALDSILSALGLILPFVILTWLTIAQNRQSGK